MIPDNVINGYQACSSASSVSNHKQNAEVSYTRKCNRKRNNDGIVSTKEYHDSSDGGQFRLEIINADASFTKIEIAPYETTNP